MTVWMWTGTALDASLRGQPMVFASDRSSLYTQSEQTKDLDMAERATPKSQGFFMPAEWTPHARTWMMWPCRAEVWESLTEVRRNYAQVAHAIRACEPVTMVVRSEDRADAASVLGSDIDLMVHPIDDSWARDAGPCFLTDAQGNRAGATFEFNAWGAKYTPFNGDNSVAEAILDATATRVFRSSLVAEGGSISVDGEGTILTTESCFPNRNRNPRWSRDEIEAELKEMLGGEKVIWLPGNLEETETDGHVDGVAVFAAPGVVVVQDPEPANHHWHAIHKANLDALSGQTDAKGRPLKLLTIPDASAYDSGYEGFCDSYVNAYICNGAVIVPKYGLREDAIAREVFEEACPGREIVEVPIDAIGMGGGGIHCITQQEPAA